MTDDGGCTVIMIVDWVLVAARHRADQRPGPADGTARAGCALAHGRGRRAGDTLVPRGGAWAAATANTRARMRKLRGDRGWGRREGYRCACCHGRVYGCRRGRGGLRFWAARGQGERKARGLSSIADAAVILRFGGACCSSRRLSTSGLRSSGRMPLWP